MRTFAILTAVVCAAPVFAQMPELPKPGPEHEMLKKREGTWTAVMKTGPGEYKGTAVFKMELGGLWLASTLDVDLGSDGGKFTGKGLDTYDPKTKAFYGVWADNMITKPLMFTGSYDAKTKVLTLTTDAPGPDGKPAKWKALDTQVDDDTIDFKMFLNDGKEPMFTLTYKRKK
jgi:hypothetical protein